MQENKKYNINIYLLNIALALVLSPRQSMYVKKKTESKKQKSHISLMM